MMIGCIDYFVDLLSMKVMKANVSGYFACFCAVVCQTTLSDLSLGRNVWLR